MKALSVLQIVDAVKSPCFETLRNAINTLSNIDTILCLCLSGSQNSHHNHQYIHVAAWNGHFRSVWIVRNWDGYVSGRNYVFPRALYRRGIYVYAYSVIWFYWILNKNFYSRLYCHNSDKLENIRAPLLSCLKLCAPFHSHRWFLTGVTVQKHPIWTLLWSLVISSKNFMIIRWWEHSEKGVTDGRVNRRTDGKYHS